MILFLTGPAGAGKSTTAKTFLDSAKGTWAYLAQDEIRQLIKSGYVSADDYEYNWSEEVRSQWQVSIKLICNIAKLYEEAGINSLVDFNASPEEFKDWEKHLKGLNYKLIVLLPSVDSVLSRNKGRDERSKLKDNKVMQNYKKLIDWGQYEVTIIDNSTGNVDDTVSKLNAIIKL